MNNLKLFKLKSHQIQEVFPSVLQLEKSLQGLVEKKLEAFLAIRFLASKFTIQGRQRGRKTL